MKHNKKYIIGLTLASISGLFIPMKLMATDNNFVTKSIGINPAGKIDLVGMNSETAKAKSSLKYFSYFEKYGEIYGIDPYLLMAIACTESNGNPNCKYGNNYGLMQINFTGSKRTITAYNFNTRKYDTINITSRSQILGSNTIDFNVKAAAMQLQEKARELYFNPLASVQGYNFGQNGLKRAIAYYISNGNVSVGKNMSLKNEELLNYIKSNDTEWITKKFNGKTALQIYTSNGGGGTHSYVSNVLGYYRGEKKQPWIMDLEGNRHIVNYTETNEPPEIIREDIELWVGDNFNPLNNVTAIDLEDGDLTRYVIVTKNAVDTSQKGEYKVSYAVLDRDGNRTDKTFNIKVNAKSNEKPNILVENKIIKVGDEFNPFEGVSSIDEEDGDLTRYTIVTQNNVDTSKQGDYYINYAVLDSDGNRTDKKISIKVVADTNTPPEIIVENKEQVIGEEINPLDGVTSIDKEDGDLTRYVIVTKNTTNILEEGEYEIRYAVLDSDGNRTDKTIKNTVKKS